MIELDKIDKRILKVLQSNGRISTADLAEAVNLTPTPCARRVKRLEDQGVIRRYVALVEPKALDLDLLVYVAIAMDQHTPERFAHFEAQMQPLDEVLECAIITGQAADYLLKVRVKDMRHYERFLLNHLTKITGVTGVQTSFVLRSVMEKTHLPVS